MGHAEAETVVVEQTRTQITAPILGRTILFQNVERRSGQNYETPTVTQGYPMASTETNAHGPSSCMPLVGYFIVYCKFVGKRALKKLPALHTRQGNVVDAPCVAHERRWRILKLVSCEDFPPGYEMEAWQEQEEKLMSGRVEHFERIVMSRRSVEWYV